MPGTATTSKISARLPAPNAGLVLLSPFLPQLFAKAGLLADGAFRDATTRTRAVVLLHFLATGETQARPAALPLPEIICGCEPAQIREANGVTITNDEAALIETLLHRALARWPRMSLSSIASFRESFLQRPGTLVAVASGWTLEVERHAMDVLLRTCPWNFSPVKHSWMPTPITVTWP